MGGPSYGPGPTSKRKAQIDASAPLQAAPEPPNCRGGLEQRRTQRLATIPSTPDPARRRRKQALVSRRLAHWQRGWGVAKGRFALWAVCAVGSGASLGQRGTWCGCPHGVRELRGPRHQVPPATARGKTACGVSRGVARGCWEGPSSPPDPQTCPVPALPPFSQPHRQPWARVFETRWRADLHAAAFHLA